MDKTIETFMQISKNPNYLKEDEMLRRIRVLKQDANGGIFSQYLGNFEEALKNNVNPKRIVEELEDLGFFGTAEKFKEFVKSQYPNMI